ncbi:MULTISPECIES: metabolite traffic protein EboE [unclassified Streptomyces]|jgi:sugar phosphate isomerase/epimerase|uniref:metabolite traffic protein EboE n=1 Tax=unclassified Streptomyces TaxID=2593676 RepID=UPI0011632B07|nr:MULTISPECIES: metabolite traffic protein EboE [unclassified Streptomyces]NMI62191.1 metabolite traffic protein EboE [Streptomyces sp. RLA2-12]QDN61216.1 sugar phosphate isomerase/epimerase [Streptomyces sp. S1D4-20]QDN71270.1 sugar phosphate isomerase/epimerase [Streptomyces sp. S1D4-14]QDO53725.1 sugar phosphate isomerase/epimerase [Streptomyces sp. RLB3-5]QDO63970.1 sugar phosphate isomerase/epimerase [Streptomyces sp. RLB1-8]
MRFRHPDGSTVHLAYCTNVHPAETLDGVLAQLRDHCEPVRRRLGRDRLGIGLWLARDAAHALVTDPSALRGLRTELEHRGLEVVTLNGFPYEGFGAEEVKYRVYQPDWADPERLAHTTDLARVLAQLLPDDVTEGSISTLPLAWRTAYDQERATAAHTALTTLAERLDALHELTGRSLRIGLEPEPGCTVETTRDALAPLTAIGHDRIGICVDTCHLATSFEDPHTALDALAQARVPIVKSQLSAALHAEHPHLPEVRAALAAFDEPRFLHQTRTLTAAGLRGTDDLGEALAGDALPDASPWRAHFHVPLHAAPAAPLTSTLPVLRAALTRLVGGPHPLTHHLEVETYTWQALPPELRPRARAQLVDGIAAELTLARDLLTDLGLKELP